MAKKILTDLDATNRYITAAAYNKTAITAPATGSTIAIANLKTFSVNATLTLAGTDSTTMTFPTTSATIARTDTGQTFSGTQIFSSTISGSVSGSAASLSSSNSINGVSFPGNSAVKVPPAYSYTATGGGTQTTGWIIALSGASAPTARPDGTSIAAGDIWISF